MESNSINEKQSSSDEDFLGEEMIPPSLSVENAIVSSYHSNDRSKRNRRNHRAQTAISILDDTDFDFKEGDVRKIVQGMFQMIPEGYLEGDIDEMTEETTKLTSAMLHDLMPMMSMVAEPGSTNEHSDPLLSPIDLWSLSQIYKDKSTEFYHILADKLSSGSYQRQHVKDPTYRKKIYLKEDLHFIRVSTTQATGGEQNHPSEEEEKEGKELSTAKSTVSAGPVECLQYFYNPQYISAQRADAFIADMHGIFRQIADSVNEENADEHNFVAHLLKIIATIEAVELEAFLDIDQNSTDGVLAWKLLLVRGQFDIN